jgi:hypothetical protein
MSMTRENNDELPNHDHRTYSIGHEFELNRGVDLEDLKRLSNALEAASELDASRPLAHFGRRFAAAELVSAKASLSLVVSGDPEQIMAKLSLFTRFKNAIYGGLRLNNMGLTVTAYSCLREAQETFDMLRLVNLDAHLAKAVLKGGYLTPGEMIDLLVPLENMQPEYAKHRHRIHSRCAPMGPDLPPVHFELDGAQGIMDVGGRRIEAAQEEFNETGLALFDDCIFEFSGERYSDLEQMHRQIMVNIYSGRSLFPGGSKK